MQIIRISYGALNFICLWMEKCESNYKLSYFRCPPEVSVTFFISIMSLLCSAETKSCFLIVKMMLPPIIIHSSSTCNAEVNKSQPSLKTYQLIKCIRRTWWVPIMEPELYRLTVNFVILILKPPNSYITFSGIKYFALSVIFKTCPVKKKTMLNKLGLYRTTWQ